MVNSRFSIKDTIIHSIGALFRPIYKVGDLEVTFNIYKAQVESGKLSYGRVNIHAYQNGGRFAVGNYTSIGEIDVVLGGEHHRGITTFPFKSKVLGFDVSKDNNSIKPVIVEHDCWIGWNVTLLEGVTVRTGTIVGAGSVITRSTNPYSIWAGNPAREIAKRFSDEEIEALLRSEWWLYPSEKLTSKIDLLYSKDVREFLRTFSG